MGLRKTGSSREYNSIDVRFSATTNEMALAMRKQRMNELSAVVKDDDITALTRSLAGGMRLKKEESVVSPSPVLATILESTEPVEDSSATDFILEGYLSSDAQTEVADDEGSIAGNTTPYLDKREMKQSFFNTPEQEMRFVGYAAEKWDAKPSTSLRNNSLPPITYGCYGEDKDGSAHALPSLHDIGVLQFIPSIKKPSSPFQTPKKRRSKGQDFEAFYRQPVFGNPASYHSTRLPAPVPLKPVYYPHKPVHYAPYGTV